MNKGKLLNGQFVMLAEPSQHLLICYGLSLRCFCVDTLQMQCVCVYVCLFFSSKMCIVTMLTYTHTQNTNLQSLFIVAFQ